MTMSHKLISLFPADFVIVVLLVGFQQLKPNKPDITFGLSPEQTDNNDSNQSSPHQKPPWQRCRCWHQQGWRPHTPLSSSGWTAPRWGRSPPPRLHTPSSGPRLWEPGGGSPSVALRCFHCTCLIETHAVRLRAQSSHWLKPFWGKSLLDGLQLHSNTYVGRIPKHWYQIILGAGYPNEVQVRVVTFSHLTTATGLSASEEEIEKSWNIQLF